MELPSVSRRWPVTVAFLGIAGILAIASAVVGISDNPPGILLAYGAAAVLVMALVHPWRSSRQFRCLFYVAALGFVVLAVVHNVFEVVAGRMGGPGVVYAVLQVIQVAAFLIAVLLCPPAAVIGLAGGVVMLIRARGRSAPKQDMGR